MSFNRQLNDLYRELVQSEKASKTSSVEDSGDMCKTEATQLPAPTPVGEPLTDLPAPSLLQEKNEQ